MHLGLRFCFGDGPSRTDIGVAMHTGTASLECEDMANCPRVACTHGRHSCAVVIYDPRLGQLDKLEGRQGHPPSWTCRACPRRREACSGHSALWGGQSSGPTLGHGRWVLQQTLCCPEYRHLAMSPRYHHTQYFPRYGPSNTDPQVLIQVLSQVPFLPLPPSQATVPRGHVGPGHVFPDSVNPFLSQMV